MFGYIKAHKPELKIAEYETYKAIYCGLCRQLGRSYGMVARMTLSYDFTFLSVLMMALAENQPDYQARRCPANPLKQCMMAELDSIQSYCADCAMLILYYKIQDDLHDKGVASRSRAVLLLPAVRSAHKKAADKLPEMDRIIAESMQLQAELESKKQVSVDEACEPSAQAMAYILSSISTQPTEQRVLGRLGYLIGRYIYLCDALDDLEDDWKKGNFNPFLQDGHPNQNQVQAAIGSLYMTIAEAAKAYELLEPKRFDSILANILYLGLKQTVDTIAEKKEVGTDDRPL